MTLRLLPAALLLLTGCAQAQLAKPCTQQAVPGEIIVTAQDPASVSETIAQIDAMEGASFERKLFDSAELQIFLVTVIKGEEEAAMTQIAALSNVKAVEQNQLGCFGG